MDNHATSRVTGMPIWRPGEFSARQWPDWSFWWADEPGRGANTRNRVVSVAVNVVALFALAPRVVEVAGAGQSAAVTGVLIGSIVGYGLGYLLAIWFGPTRSHGQRAAMVAAVFALALVPALLLRSPGYLTDATFAISIGLMLLPLRYSLLLGSVTAAGQIVWMWLGYDHLEWLLVGTLVGVTAVLGMVFALLFTIGHLRAAREQVRSLAVAQERERVARDLHDVLGHSLSTMTLKTGLARRMLESSGDVEQVTTEIREIEGLTRQALSDVRATVSDYRTVTLSTEIAGARVALRAAGVRADLPTVAADDVVPELHSVFGYVVREAVTNVIRHSGAQQCRIRLGRNWVAITDDGRGATDGPGAPGNGLTGLAERLAAVSGTLEHSPRPGGGFEVVARGSAPHSPVAPTEQSDRGGTT